MHLVAFDRFNQKFRVECGLGLLNRLEGTDGMLRGTGSNVTAREKEVGLSVWSAS